MRKPRELVRKAVAVPEAQRVVHQVVRLVGVLLVVQPERGQLELQEPLRALSPV
jgi:hypothetical protein